MSNRFNKKKRKVKPKPKIGHRTVSSDFEYQIYKILKGMLPKGATIEYESEKLTYVIEATYTPDFVITFKDGRKLYIEAKGNGRQFDQFVKQKMIAVKDQHPDKDIRIVFYSDGKVGNTRKDGTYMRQSDWASKNNYVFSIREIPKDWIK